MIECVKNHCPDLPYGVQSVSHCTVCHETFASNRVGDAHRVGPFDPSGQRRCLSIPEMEAKGWVRNAKGCWVSGRVMNPEYLRRLKQPGPVG